MTTPSSSGPPDRAEFARRWSAAHGGADPAARFVAGYLTVVQTLARPLAAAGACPDAVTATGPLVAAAALWPAAAGGRWVLLVPLLVVASAVLDGLDGALALLTARSTRWGAVLDGVADRVADLAWTATLWLLGAPGWLVAAAAAVGWLHEYVRARAGAAGMTGVARVTVGERPTRAVVVVLFALGAGLYPAAAAGWATAGAAALVGVGAAGLVQLLPAVRRELR